MLYILYMYGVCSLMDAVCLGAVLVLQVIRATGFMKGLFSETEMKSENVKVSRA